MAAPKKPGHLLLEAFKAMNEPNGLTATQIIKYYSKTHDVPLSRATLAVQRALRMGLATGFVDKKRNRFLLGTEEGDVQALLPRSPVSDHDFPDTDTPAVDANSLDPDDSPNQHTVTRKQRRRRDSGAKEAPRYHCMSYRKKYSYALGERAPKGMRRRRNHSPYSQSLSRTARGRSRSPARSDSSQDDDRERSRSPR